MSTINPETPIGRVVAEHPASAQLFDRLGVDYCCGGDQALHRACAKEGLDAATVLQMIDSEIDLDAHTENGSETRDWTEVPLGDLIDHIESTHHAYLRSELPRLEELLEKVAHVHGTDAPWVGSVKEVFADLKPSMEAHIRKEEEIVFPFIRRLVEEGPVSEPDGLDGDPIALMEEEHDETGEALKRMCTLSHNFTTPRWGCNSFRSVMSGLKRLEADTHRHVHKENSILFPRARALL